MIIGITGFIGSGKDTVANYLTTHHGFKRESFAGRLKDAVANVFSWDREMLEGSTKSSREWREQVDPWWSERLNMPQLTPRWVLQQWGTDVLRAGFHDDIWIAAVENKLRAAQDNIVITDCRFANEFKAISDAGGVTIRVNRGSQPEWYDAAIAYNKEPEYTVAYAMAKQKLEELKVHASEYSSVGINYDYQLDNNGTIDSLHEQIADILVNL